MLAEMDRIEKIPRVREACHGLRHAFSASLVRVRHAWCKAAPVDSTKEEVVFA
jgi:hypothetical protein